MKSCATCTHYQPLVEQLGECRAETPIAIIDDTEHGTTVDGQWPAVWPHSWCATHTPTRHDTPTPLHRMRTTAVRLTRTLTGHKETT